MPRPAIVAAAAAVGLPASNMAVASAPIVFSLLAEDAGGDFVAGDEGEVIVASTCGLGTTVFAAGGDSGSAVASAGGGYSTVGALAIFCRSPSGGSF